MPSRIGAWTSPIITRHGSELLEQSDIFACQHCASPMNYVVLPCGETALECNSERCGWPLGGSGGHGRDAGRKRISSIRKSRLTDQTRQRQRRAGGAAYDKFYHEL